MKLIYRGHTYDYDPTKTAPSGPRHQEPVQLTYRGTTYTYDPNAAPMPMPAESAPYQLIYRGVTYWKGGAAPTATPAPAAATPTKAAGRSGNLQPSDVKRHYERVHRANLLQNVQSRLQAAQARGDQQLVNLLKAELQQIG